MTRRLRDEDWWGDDGDTLVVFGHVDLAELEAAAERWGREQWGLWPDDFALVNRPVHAFAIIRMNDWDEPWLHWQRQPEHPDGFDLYPITVSVGDGSFLPDVADMSGYTIGHVPTTGEPASVGRPVSDPLADRLIAKNVHSAEGGQS